MMLPTIHMNGTSRAELERQIDAAHRAVAFAIGALNSAAPNGRDYYPQGSHAIYVAQEEHEKRIAALVTVQNELEQLYEHITGA